MESDRDVEMQCQGSGKKVERRGCQVTRKKRKKEMKIYFTEQN